MPKQLVLPAQPVPNPNRQIATVAYEIDQENSVSLNAIDCNDIQLRYGKKLVEPAPPIITKITEEEGIHKIDKANQSVTQVQK